jgi:iron complex transport system substrate-binding protein
MRILSLTCSNTEITCALGAGSSLVGVDDYSDYPLETVRELPRVGKDLNIDIEKVVALKPDLILASLTVPGHERVVAEVEKTGIPYLAPSPKSLADVAQDFRDIGRLLGREAAGAALAEDLFRNTPAVETSSRPKLLVEWWPKPVIVPTQYSWVSDLIERAGGQNPFAHIARESAPLSDEDVKAAQPNIVVISWCGVAESKLNPAVVAKRPGWATIPAVQTNRIVIIPESLLGRPGPRLVDGYRALRRVIHDCVEESHDTP